MTSRFRINLAAERIAAGDVIAHPTEGVYGLACDPDNRGALRKVLALKRRRAEQGLILIAADFAQLQRFVAPLEPAVLAQLQPEWPGPVTFLVPRATDIDPLICGAHATVAIRVTAHPLSRALCNACGHALISTSANRSGRRPATTAQGVRRQFGCDVGLVLAGPLGGARGPSRIVDARSGETIRG